MARANVTVSKRESSLPLQGQPEPVTLRDAAFPLTMVGDDTAPLLRIALRGTLSATTHEAHSLLPRGRKTRALLALLALASPDPVRRDRITALLWSGRGAEQARASLRQCLHELQEALAPAGDGFIAAERMHLALRGRGLHIDMHPAFNVAPAVLAETAHPSRLLEDLAGVDPAFDRFLAEERHRLLRAEVSRAEAMLAAQDTPAARLAAADVLLGIDSTHEGAWRAAIQAHSDRGDLAAAGVACERCIATLADALGTPPSPETQALIANLRPRPSQPPAAAARRQGPGVRLGVMPLRALGGGDDAGLSLGLADEITTALSRFRWLFLIASPSVAAVARGTEAREPAAAGHNWRDLDLDFLLDGTIQRSRERVRVNLRLLDMRAAGLRNPDGPPGGEVVWAGRFDRDADDILTLQDEIAAEAVAQLDPELLQHESRRAGLRPASSATAYDLVLRAIPALYQLVEPEFRAAGAMLERAVALDPGYAAAHAWWAYWHIFLVGQGWTTQRDAAMASAGELAERAVKLDPADARALTIAGHVRAFLHRQVPEALELHERALALNPNLPLAWVFSGLAHSYDGRHGEAIRRIREARRLSPFDPNAFFFDNSLMVPHLLLGQFAQVVELGRRASALNPTLSSTFKVLLSALGHLGEASEAAMVRARLLLLEPGYTLAMAATRTTFRHAADRAIFLDGLRRAGLPQ